MTPAMKEAGWKYGHRSQVILDGTFGVCNKKILLFIMMGVDELNRRVPLALFLFSAPSDNKRKSAGYNTEVLERLLQKWKEAMGTRNGEAFLPKVAITDTDMVERGALLKVFPDIWLLICKFHIRQSWKNHCNTHTRGNTGVHTQVKARLRAVENVLIESHDHVAAKKIVEDEREILQRQRETELNLTAKERAALEGAEEHLRYLNEYWLWEGLWQNWSLYGWQQGWDATLTP